MTEEQARAEDHHRKLERMYASAPTNAYYRPRMTVSDGEAVVELDVRRELFHAAGAVHGSAYFKALDDACFFAANSLVESTFVLTVSFQLYLTRPVTEGLMRASGRVVHRSSRLLVAEGVLEDGDGRQLARGSGSFMPSQIPLTPEIGYA